MNFEPQKLSLARSQPLIYSRQWGDGGNPGPTTLRLLVSMSCLFDTQSIFYNLGQIIKMTSILPLSLSVLFDQPPHATTLQHSCLQKVPSSSHFPPYSKTPCPRGIYILLSLSSHIFTIRLFSKLIQNIF